MPFEHNDDLRRQHQCHARSAKQRDPAAQPIASASPTHPISAVSRNPFLKYWVRPFQTAGNPCKSREKPSLKVPKQTLNRGKKSLRDEGVKNEFYGDRGEVEMVETEEEDVGFATPEDSVSEQSSASGEVEQSGSGSYTRSSSSCSSSSSSSSSLSSPASEVEVEASSVGVGAVLSQFFEDQKAHPCAYFSRRFSPAEQNYTIGEQELLAIKLAFQEWRYFLEGAQHPISSLPALEALAAELALQQFTKMWRQVHEAVPSLKVGDQVWISTRNLRLKVPYKKFAPRFIGPYPIEKERQSDMKKMKKHKPAAVLLLSALCCITPITGCCKDLHCTVDYIDTLTCIYSGDKEENTSISYTLHAEWTLEESEETCDLISPGRRQEYICTINMENFNVDDKCTVFITAKVNGHSHSNKTCGPFSIGDRFEPTTPFNLTVSFVESYNVTWKTSYDNNIVINGELAYELGFKKDKESWQNQKSIQVLEDEKHVVFLSSSFQANELYVARIRARPKPESIYRGQWSAWSTPVIWRTPDDEFIKTSSQNWISLIYFLPVFLLIVIMLILKCLKWPQCLWKKVWLLVPDPAPFFKPLYEGHHGDFKSWLGPYFPTMHSQVGILTPEVDILEIHCPSLKNNPEKQTLFPPKSCSSNCRKCGGIGDIREKISKQRFIDNQCCFHCLTNTNTTMDGLEASIDEEDDSKDDGYPDIDLDSGTGNTLNDLVNHRSNPEGAEKSKVDFKFHPQENVLRDNMNILDLLSVPPEEWELHESSCQEEDENVFYNDENYNALSPDSGNSTDFGYPQMCLDLDTIDSGFVDSECGSPVDSDFGNREMTTKTLSSDSYCGEGEIGKTNYVKQWVPSDSMGTVHQRGPDAFPHG
ncbi:interleukin-21 receptor [Pseudophryne corroboree]|uniref:interleukin-21 receptor n=1 Tax=Pseudophryne corroboree TaxID=495146 RepID=UPI003081AA38